MQYALDFGTPTPLVVLHDRLKAHYGIQIPGPRFPPVSMLIVAMLGSRTRDAVSLKAFHNLRTAFLDWDAVAEASYDQIYSHIRNVTFPEKYAAYLPDVLRAIIQKRGTLDLDFLDSWSVEQAREWLEKLCGVGPKVSACVLNFSDLHKRALVIDTHYLRFAKRVGLIPDNRPINRVVIALERQIPNSWNEDESEMNYILVRLLTEEFCSANSPKCSSCPLQDICAYGEQFHNKNGK
ncbi:Fe-S cluster assembly protein HesB [Phyllobacterium sp. LjRoot231]|uniref:endonuclease III domain-containing protein n=1 Tax=Phyllobacterium sp. LjRoot231 TaxID=3342289 RepID=UPI003ED108FC